jgi:hypothetical protein
MVRRSSGAEGGAGLVEELGAFAAGEEFAAAGGELGEGGVRGAAGGFAAHDVQAELGEMFAQGGGVLLVLDEAGGGPAVRRDHLELGGGAVAAARHGDQAGEREGPGR